MKKFAFIGAGSFIFTRNLVKDILSYPAFSDSIIALMDVDEERLSYIKKAVDKIVETGGYPATVIATRDRVEALKDADGVLITIRASTLEDIRNDVEIPKKYGVDICIGDTRGPAAIFKYLRTIPVMMDICKDVEKYCPNALVLNYTNPMAMICRHLQSETKLAVTGLCHSVQHTVKQVADLIQIPGQEITYLCAGINHQAWYLEMKWKGQDIYPMLREALKNPETYNKEKVRNEMFLHLDYYVTESSRHNSEYNSWFRKRPDLIEKNVMGMPPKKEGWPMDGEYAYNLKMYLAQENTWRQDILNWIEKEVDLKRGVEYAASIFNAVFGDGALFQFNGNVRNANYIENLPYGCCVEVPVLASPRGLTPMHVGDLPAHLAILNNINARCEELAVEAALEGDIRKVFHAICFDPLTSAVLSLAEIKDMVNEMLEANQGKLPQFKNLKI